MTATASNIVLGSPRHCAECASDLRSGSNYLCEDIKEVELSNTLFRTMPGGDSGVRRYSRRLLASCQLGSGIRGFGNHKLNTIYT